MGYARWVAMNMPPVLVYLSEDMMLLIMLHMICMRELCIVFVCLAVSLLRM